MLKEFREFAMEGSVLDLAVGVVIGGVFGEIVSSLVNDIIMPVVGMIIGNVDFSNLFISLDGGSYATLKQAEDAGAATLNYGLFINAIIQFLIISFSLFIVIKQVNKLRKEEPVTTKECKYCLTEIPLEATRCLNCTSILNEVE